MADVEEFFVSIVYRIVVLLLFWTYLVVPSFTMLGIHLILYALHLLFDRVAFLFQVSPCLVELFVELLILVAIALHPLSIVLLFYLYLVALDKVKHLLLGKTLTLLFEPSRQPHPLVFACLQAACLLYHSKPLLWRSLLLLDVLYSTFCVAVEGRLAIELARLVLCLPLIIRFKAILAHTLMRRQYLYATFCEDR